MVEGNDKFPTFDFKSAWKGFSDSTASDSETNQEVVEEKKSKKMSPREEYYSKMTFNPETATFDIADENIKKIRELRSRLKENNRDPLADKEHEMKLGLNEMEFSEEDKKQGLNNLEFSEKDMGKTGDSRTGEVSEKHKKIARSQVEDAKSMMLQKRMLEGKISSK